MANFRFLRFMSLLTRYCFCVVVIGCCGVRGIDAMMDGVLCACPSRSCGVCVVWKEGSGCCELPYEVVEGCVEEERKQTLYLTTTVVTYYMRSILTQPVSSDGRCHVK